MWYTVVFIAGAFLGVMVMAVLASATLDKLEWENAHLSRIIHDQERTAAQRYSREKVA